MDNTEIPPSTSDHVAEGRKYKGFGENDKRKVYDNIHGFIYFKQIIWDFIDTRHFQRLRKIKQLGCLQYVFPGATNTRFEHSIGTAYLAKKFIEALIDNNRGSYKRQQEKDAILTVTLAGLLHDIGHGPYSHTFDSYIVTQIKKKDEHGKEKIVEWNHELASVALFDHLTKFELKGRLTEEQIRRIKMLIIGQLPKDQKDRYRIWEYQLISNKVNGIDVDKLDYFRRDAFYLGAKNIFVDHDLLMNQAKIIDNEICYPTKYDEIVYSIFHCRYKLYKTFYFNVVSKGIEEMVCDVLLKTKDTLKLKQACEEIFDDPSKYIKLTDSILEKIEDICQNLVERNRQQEKVQRQKFQEAVVILNRIKTRDLYKFVKQYHYYIKENQDPEILNTIKDSFQKAVILENISKKSGVDPSLISISICGIHFGFKEKNPLKNIGFFKKQDAYPTKLKPEETESLSMLFTNAYLEKSIKVFIKTDDIEKHKAVQRAFTSYCHDMNSKCKSVCKEIGVNNFILQGRGGTPSVVLPQNSNSVQALFSNPLNSIERLRDEDYQ